MPPAVLITGAARRIGAVLARAFGAAGWHVVIHHGHSPEEAEALAPACPRPKWSHCDLLDGDAAEDMVIELAERLPDWRMLINCAAVFEHDDCGSNRP